MCNRSLTLVCKGGASVQARTATLAGASPVLCEALDKPLATAGELRLEADDPETWTVVLGLLDPKEHPQAPALSTANLESVLVLADKYDMAAVRCICVGFMGIQLGGVCMLDAPLTSPMNILKATSLIERYCGQPDMQQYTQPVMVVFNTALANASFTNIARFELLAKLKPHVTLSNEFQEHVAPGVQAKVIRLLASSLDGMRRCHSCGCLHGFTGSPAGTYSSVKCAQCCKVLC